MNMNLLILQEYMGKLHMCLIYNNREGLLEVVSENYEINWYSVPESIQRKYLALMAVVQTKILN